MNPRLLSPVARLARSASGYEPPVTQSHRAAKGTRAFTNPSMNAASQVQPWSRRGVAWGTSLLALGISATDTPLPALAGSDSRRIVRPSRSAVIPLSPALQALALHSGRVVVYVGNPPARGVAAPPEAGSLVEVANHWAERWSAVPFCTPDVLFFLAPGTFRHVRPAHHDDQLVAHRVLPLLHSLPLSLLARVSPVMGELTPDAEPNPEREGITLEEWEREHAESAAELRALLRQADARAGGADSPGGPVALHSVPGARLRLRLRGQTLAVCGLGAQSVALEFPLSLSRYAVQHPFAGDAAPLRHSLERTVPAGTALIQGKLGDLLRSGRLLPKRAPGMEIVVDRRLRELPLRIAVPSSYRGKPLWPLLERGVGVERRELGPVEFFGPWLDADREERFRLLGRWAQARGDLYLPLFTPFVTRPRWIMPRALEEKTRETLLAELRRLRAEGHAGARRISPPEFLKRGRLMLTQREHLEVLYLAEPGAGRPPTVLGRHRFLLQ